MEVLTRIMRRCSTGLLRTGLFVCALACVLYAPGEVLAAPTVQFTYPSSGGAESITPAALEVRLSEVLGLDVTVDYAVTGGTAAGEGVDYTLAAGQATIPAGDLTTTIDVAIVNDALDEPDETVVVELSDPTNADLGDDTVHTYTITDDDDPTTVSFTDTPYTHDENGAQTVTVTLGAESGKEVSVNYATSGGTATAGEDYTAASGTLTWAIGETGDKSFDVPILTDSLDEDDETVTLTLSPESNCTIAGDNPATLAITDDDVTVTFSPGNYTIGEHEGSIDITVTLSEESQETVTVEWAATGGFGYNPTAGTLTFDPGDISNAFTITIEDDSVYRFDRIVDLTLDPSSDNVELGDPSTAILTIEDDDTVLFVGAGEAYATIQSALDNALPGHTVVVRAGTYTGVGNKNLDFNGKAITLYSEYGKDTCIIDCEELGRGFTFQSGEGAGSVVSGFTIKRGSTIKGSGIYCDSSSPSISDCTITDNLAQRGAGIGCEGSSSPTITNCTIIGNSAIYGSGIYCDSSSPTITNCTISSNTNRGSGSGIYCDSSSPTVTNCTISNNTTSVDGAGVWCGGSSTPAFTNCTISGNSAIYCGGGIYCDSSSPTITHCAINGNTAHYIGVSSFGGGIYCSHSSPTVDNCTLTGNQSQDGGGIWCEASSSPTITNCTISGNTALSHGGGGINSLNSSPAITNCIISGNWALTTGGGIYAWSNNSTLPDPVITNCIISSNYATRGGGGMGFNFSSPTIINCTISANSAPCGGGIYYFYFSSPTITNSILWGNSPDEIFDTEGGDPLVTYSDIQGGYIGQGNLNANPLFAGPSDYHLTPSSPCRAAGTSSGAPPTDIEGNVRDNPPSIGAYESPCLPEFTSLGLRQSLDQATWQDVSGDLTGGYTMELDPAEDHYYADTGQVSTNIPLMEGFYGFTIDSYPAGFFEYWADPVRGVDENAVTGTEAEHLWQIINGNSPAFYIHAQAGGTFALIDGLQRDFYDSTTAWQINGDSPLGVYAYAGKIRGEDGRDSEDIEIRILFYGPETAPEFTSLGLRQSLDQATWQDVSGDLTGGYTMELDPAEDHYYADTGQVSTNIPLKEGFYGFTIDSYPAGFFEYWADQGVVEDSVPGTEAEHLWQIINGNSPAFYIHAQAGGTFALIDGLQRDFYDSTTAWQINGDSPLGVYAYGGTITGVNDVSAPVSLSITFKILDYTLTIGVTGSGSTLPAAGTHAYDVGSVVELNAYPSSDDWIFGGWIGDVANPTSPSTTVTMDGDKTVTARFTPKTCTLTIQPTTGGTTLPAAGTYTYNAGSVVNLIATPLQYWEFDSWTGDVADPASRYTSVTMDGDKTVKATFSQETAEYTLTMQVTGSGSTWPLPGSYTYSVGSVVNLIADPSSGWKFDGWTGDVADPASWSTTVTMDGDKIVTARFSQAIFNLTMQITGNGSTLPAVGTHTYNTGDVINILAMPSGGWEFDSWTGEVADPTSPSTTVTMDGDKTVEATFTKQTPQCTLTMKVTGSGSTLPAAGTHNYIPGAVVNLLAMPSDGWEFGGWIGEVADPASTSTSVTMDGDKTVTATFTNPSVKSKPVINSFTAEPQTIHKGGSGILSWKITGASLASIDNGIGDVDVSNGSLHVYPSGMTTYTLMAANDAGTVTATITVGVIVEEAVVVGGPANGASLGISEGVFEGVPTSIAAPEESPEIFPFGLIEFTITDVTPGAYVTVYVTLPRPIPPGATYYKYLKGAFWPYSNVGGLNDGDDTFFIIIGDGQQLGDADGFRNGRIVDPGGLAFPAKLYFPHVDSGGAWETEIGVINTSGTEGLSGTFTAYSDEGEAVSEDIDITLAPYARRELTIGTDFVNPGDIGYVVFEADSGSLVGYTKFYVSGRYRVAVPAAYEANANSIYIPHIASDQSWWTGVSLLNTTSAPVDLTIDFDNGERKSIALAPGEHQAFTIRDLFEGEPQEDIHSAVITSASGVVGLELFGSAGGGNQLSGILLKGDTASTIYYPHIDSYSLNPASSWWTGIVAYNPSESSSTIIITPYTAEGTPLATQGISIDPHGKYIGTVAELSLPSQTAWLKIDSTNSITGFELFGTIDGNQLAGYTAVQIDGREGVFAKIEDDGWTGIAFVNIEGSQASVTLTAYDDLGTAVATQTLSLDGYAKAVDLAENFFVGEDISTATYLRYTSDRDVVGFQLNGSPDGMMLDGLPGMK